MNIRRILIPALLFAAFTGANAQQRTCDLGVTLIEPAASAVINAFAQYNLRVNITNNGPDTLFAGDTLYYNKPSQPLFDYSTYILTQPVFPHTNVSLTLETLHNVNQDQTDQVMDYYIFVVSNPAGNGSFVDNNEDNDYDVNANVTFRAGNPTAIDDIQKDKIALELFPNPAASGVTFRLEAGNAARTAIISDMTGREVISREFSKKGDNSLDISTLLPGMYILQLETEQGRAVARFLKK